MRNMRLITGILLMAIFFSLAACARSSASPTVQVDIPALQTSVAGFVTATAAAGAVQLPTVAIPTAVSSPVPPVITATPQPSQPATAVPTATQAASTGTSSGTAIQFAAGTTSAEVSGSLAAGQSRSYTVRALANQVMQVSLSSANPAGIAVLKGNGAALNGIFSSDTSWTGILPANDTYQIRVTAGSAEVQFLLDLTIPQIIAFKPGAISQTLNGTIQPGHPVMSYIAYASKGQTMKVDVSAPKQDVYLTIYGLEDGQPLIRSASGATTFNQQLPGTQYYVIDLEGSTASENYSFTVTIQ